MNAGAAHGGTNCLLHGTLVDMMTAPLARAWIHAYPVCHEHVLPAPLQLCVRVLAGQRVRQEDGAEALHAVALEHSLAVSQMPSERHDQLVGERDHAILGTLAIPH